MKILIKKKDKKDKKNYKRLLYVLLKIVDTPISSAFPNFALMESNAAFHSVFYFFQG